MTRLPAVIVHGGGGEVGFDRATGSILFVRETALNAATIAFTPAAGDLWSLRLRGGQTLRAGDCLKNQPISLKRLGPESVAFVYSAPQGGDVIVNAAGSPEGVNLRLAAHGLSDDALTVALPDDLAFHPATLRRALFPEHLGIALKPSFYETHAVPVGWQSEPIGPDGLKQVAGIACLMPPTDKAAISVHATALARTLFGQDIAAAWESLPEKVDRPSSSAPDVSLLNSDAGVYLGGHRVGQGMLLRFGGGLPSYQDDLINHTLEQLIAAALRSRDLFGLPPASNRTRVVMILPRYQPPGSALSLSVADLQSSLAAMGLNLQASAADTPAALQSALTDPRTLAVLNPYGESFLAGTDWRGMLDSIHGYLENGGVWLETGGYSFYYHLQGNPYLRLEDHYPSRSFSDFARIESSAGAVSVYGVQPDQGRSGFVFTPASWTTFGDESGGHLERTWQTFLPKSGGSAPAVRLRMADIDAAAALRAYIQDNDLGRPLAVKMPPDKLALWKRSIHIKLNSSTVDDEMAMLGQLPAPAVLHEVSYLHGGFDRQYPDHLPPNPRYGTPQQLRQFLAAAHAKGDLVMPYTNTTWWPDNPKSPAFQAAGNAPLLIGLDGKPNHEIYGPGSSGWSITPHDPAVIASIDRLAMQFTRLYPVDILFGDQNGARPMMYDLNPASPRPYAFTQGMIDLASRTASKSKLPVATEDGFDGLLGVESEFCGLTQEIIPYPYDQTQLLSNRMPDADWEFFPMAEYVGHDKAFFISHDLGEGVWNNEALAWSLALGYGLSYAVDLNSLADPAQKRWIDALSQLQQKLGPAYMGASLTSFRYLQGSGSQGVIEAAYGKMRVIANVSDTPFTASDGAVIPAHGFRAQVTTDISVAPPAGN